MKVEKKDLEKSQVELTVELSSEEFKPYINEGAREVSHEVKIPGFRPGNVPYEILKQKIGEMGILEQAAKIAISKTINKIIEEHLADKHPIGQPRVDITKLAPQNPLEFKIILAIIPLIILGEYKGFNIEPEKLNVEEKDVEKTISYIIESRAKEVLVEREVKEGDKVVAKIEMFLDKVPLEGGQSNDTAIIIGKNYFVPGFDKKLIGAKKGEAREFSLPYPRDFYQKNLAGKMIEFRVNIKDVFERQLPALDDEFAKSFGSGNMEELKKNIKESIEMEKKIEVDKKNELNVVNKIIEKTKFGDLPEILIESETEKMMAEIEDNIVRQGGKFEDYLSSIKKTRNELVLELLPDALKRVKGALIIREIALKEKIEATKEEVEKKQGELLKQYAGYKKVEERLNDQSYKAYLQNLLSNQKVMEKLREWNLKK